MPRYVLGPRIGVVTIPDAFEPPVFGKADQDCHFLGAGSGSALYSLPAFDPATTEPIVRIHACFVRPPMPPDVDAAWLLGAAAVIRSAEHVVQTPGEPQTVSVPFPTLEVGTWDGQTVLEYAT